MKVAIVAPSPVPFTMGGTERLVCRLAHHVNSKTRHCAEIVKLPVRESTLPELVAAYRAFAELDLSHFDAVISTKYPSWMVQHENHVCYMVHRLRGLYDTYPTGMPLDYRGAERREVTALLDRITRWAGRRDALAEAIDEIEKLLATSVDGIQQLPGPFARAVVRYLDGIGLAPHAVRRYAAISRTVASRPGYFPPGAAPTVAYPQPHTPELVPATERHLFTASRLDAPKRVRLLVDAMRYVEDDIELFIAGTGPEEELLGELAGADERIHLLGYAAEDEVARLYGRALAVPFVPYREDLGLVTLEAMAYGKPVITCADSEGPLEFITDERNGLVAPPRSRAIGARIASLCSDPGRARRLGAAGRAYVESLSWHEVLRRLLPEADRHPRVRRRRPKLVAATTFPVFPPRNGGQSRVFNLLRHLPADVEVVSLAPSGRPEGSRQVASNIVEHRVAQSEAHAAAEAELSRAVDWTPVTDIAMSRLHHETPAYLEALRKATQGCDRVIAVHPFVYGVIREATNKPLWYEAQDFQLALKRMLLPRGAASERLLEQVRAAESSCCADAELVITCSPADAEAMRREYDIERGRIACVPNGVDIERFAPIGTAERDSLRRRLGIHTGLACLFIGSWHGPNLAAIEWLIEAAPRLPRCHFLIVGSACWAFAERAVPPNVVLLGEVDDQRLELCLQAAHVAVNPIAYGTGTNLKMLEYLAAGLPVLTTAVGLRGLPLRDREHVSVVELAHFVDALAAARKDYAEHQRRAAAGRAQVREQFDWRRIARSFADQFLAGSS